MPVTPLINGTSYNWANIKFTMFGSIIIGITEIDYDRKQKKENQYGWGTEAISRGYGNIENSGSITVYEEEWRRIIKAAGNFDPLSIPPFAISVLFGNSQLDYHEDQLNMCEFTDDSFTAKQNDTKLMRKLPLIIGSIAHKS